MKKTQNYKFLPLCILILCMAQTSMIICPPPAQKAAGQKSSLPATPHTKKPTKPAATNTNNSLFNPTMSTASINEKAIDTMYGKTGLNLPTTDVTQIKQTYSYIECIVKSHKIATDPTLKNIYNRLLKISSSKKNSHLVSQEIINSKEWKSVVITSAEIESSDIWQLYLKSAIVDYYQDQQDFIETISMIEDQIFPYLANIELNFYNNDFIQLRAFAELLRAKKMLQDATFHKNLIACIDWKNKDQATIDANVAAFKLTDFYNYTHDKTKWATTNTNLKHPLIEQVMSYFMLATIQSIVLDKLAQKNLLSLLTQASSLTLSPNFFYYQPSDFVYLDDILTLQTLLNNKAHTTAVSAGSELQSFNISDLVDMSKAGIQKESGNNTKTSSEPDNVVIQKSKNPFKKMGKSISKGFDDAGKSISHAADTASNDITTAADDTSKGIVSTADTVATGTVNTATTVANSSTVKAVELTATAVGEGVAGSAAVGYGAISGDTSASNWGKQENKQASIDGTDTGNAISGTSAAIGQSMIGSEAVYLGTITDSKATKDWGNQQNQDALKDTKKAGFASTGKGNTYGSMTADTSSGVVQTTNTAIKDLGVKDIGSAIVSTGDALGHAAQGIGYGITGSSKATAQFNQSGKDFNKAIKTLSHMPLIGTMTHGVEGVALGAAGFGATMLGDIVYAASGNKTVKNWGAAESSRAVSDLQQAGKDVNTVINGVAKALEDGIVAPMALTAGNALGFITQDKQMGQGLTIVLNQVCDSAIALGATCLTSFNNLLNQELVAIYKVSESGTQMIVDAIMTVYGGLTGQMSVVHRSTAMTTATSKSLGKNMVQAITGSLSCVMTSAMDMVMGVAAVMAAITNGITSIVFDVVDEITFLGCGLGELFGAPVNAAQERDKVNAKMEAHRSTINIVVSVVLMIVPVLLTGGAAAPEVGAVISAEAGGQAAVETTTLTAEEIAAKEAAQQAAKAAAIRSAQITAAQQVAAQATSQGATEGAVVTVSTTTSAIAGEGAVTVAGESSTLAAEGTAKVATTTIATDTTTTATTDLVATSENSVASTQEIGVTAKAATQVTDMAASQGVKDSSFLATYGAEIFGQAINLVFSVFSVMSADNQDEAAIRMLAQEKASIMNLWQFIENNKVVMTQSQDLYIDELHKKHQVAIENQTFGLNYYTNYLNSSINNIQNQISHALSQQYIDMLTPDANGSRTADIGSTWGLTTPFVYLYPSQGFLTTTLGRTDFPYAQEIAQAPLIAQNKGTDAAKDNLDSSKKEPSKSWFNQRAVANVNQAVDTPLNVQIKFKIIYSLTSDFYVGLYLGGKYYDYNSPEYLADIQNSGTIHLDDAHLAKMFVLKREGNEKTPSLGVYENEGNGWIANKPLNATLFNNASTYHMSATLNKDKLTVSFWPEDKPLAKWSSTVSVTPCDQKTFGVIFSGAAVEWNVVKPSMPINQNSKIRTGISNPPEADRERTAKKIWAALKNPPFGTMKLETLGKKYLIQGQYLYITQDTKLTTNDGKIIADTVAFATFASGVLSNIGMSPVATDASASAKNQKQPNAIVSMINGNIYDDKGTVLDTKQNPWPLFAKNNGPFDKTLMTAIEKAQNSVPQKAAPVTPEPVVAKKATPAATVPSTPKKSAPATTTPSTSLSTTSSSTPAASNYGTVSLSDMAVSVTPSTGGFQFGLSNQVPAAKAPAQSLDKRQAQAAGDATVQVGGLAGSNTTPVTMSGATVGAVGFSL